MMDKNNYIPTEEDISPIKKQIKLWLRNCHRQYNKKIDWYTFLTGKAEDLAKSLAKLIVADLAQAITDLAREKNDELGGGG